MEPLFLWDYGGPPQYGPGSPHFCHSFLLDSSNYIHHWIRAACPGLQLTCSSSSTVLRPLKHKLSKLLTCFSTAHSLFLVLRNTSPSFESQNLPLPYSRSAPPFRPAILVWGQPDLFSIPQLSSKDGCLLLPTGQSLGTQWQQVFIDWQALT